MTEAIWLVKSENTILGPFATEEIHKFLLQKNFSFLVEVKGPQEPYWMTVRDHPAFAQWVRIMNEGDLTQDLTAHTRATVTDTSPSDAKLGSTNRVGDEVSIRASTGPSENPLRPGDFGYGAHKQTNQNRNQARALSAAHVSGNSGPFATDLPQRRGSFLRAFLAKGILTVIFLGALTEGYYWYSLQQQNQQQLQLDLQSAREEFQLQHFDLVETIYQKWEKKDPELLSTHLKDKDYLIRAQIHVQREEWMQAGNMLSRVQKPDVFADWRQWMYLKLGLAFEQQNLAQAEQWLMEMEPSLKNELDFKVLRSWLRFQKREWDRALEGIVQTLQESGYAPPQSDYLRILLGRIFLEKVKATQGKWEESQLSDLTWLEEERQDYDPYYFHKGILLASALVYQSKAKARDILYTLLDINFLEVPQFVAPMGFYHEPFHFKYLLESCSHVVSQVDYERQDPKVQALEVICLYLAQRELQAKDKVLQLIKKFPQNMGLQSLKALLNRQPVTRCEGSGFICQLAAFYYCFEGGGNCPLDNSLAQRLKGIGPVWLLAEAELLRKRGDDFGFRSRIAQGLKVYPAYRPFKERKP